MALTCSTTARELVQGLNGIKDVKADMSIGGAEILIVFNGNKSSDNKAVTFAIGFTMTGDLLALDMNAVRTTVVTAVPSNEDFSNRIEQAMLQLMQILKNDLGFQEMREKAA